MAAKRKRVAKRAPARRSRRRKVVDDEPTTSILNRHTVSDREWDRMTELLALFAMTGHGRLKVGEEAPARPRPQSIVLVGPPGKGKSELLERFRSNKHLEYKSDLTVRGLWRLLQYADKGRISHIVLLEFQKVFQRKATTADNCVGTLTEAMEEGIYDTEVGPAKWTFNGARLGLLAGMTGRSLSRRRGKLYEMGFLDRAAMIPWDPPDDYIEEVLERAAKGDRRDLARIILPIPAKPVVVSQPVKIGMQMKEYVWKHWPDSALRMFSRFRYLIMASAMLEGRDVCRDSDVERAIHQFRDYWDKLVLSEGLEDSAPVSG